MTTNFGKLGMAAVAGTSLLLVPAVTAIAATSDSGTAEAVQVQAADSSTDSAAVSPDKVEGSFSFNQTAVSSLSDVARALGQSAKHLCGSAYAGSSSEDGVSDAREWAVSVRGDVQSAFTATLGEMAEEGSASIVMGCSCAGNPAGGLATANAEVNGITFGSIMKRAGVAEDANTVVFSSADGYEVALPLAYVTQRYSMIVYEINGCELADSVGGTNQLWLGSTSGQYFARDIVSISFETRETPPPNPYTEAGDAYYGNFPGIGVTSAE